MAIAGMALSIETYAIGFGGFGRAVGELASRSVGHNAPHPVPGSGVHPSGATEACYAIAGAMLRPMTEVVSLMRRKVVISLEKRYAELDVRSFYKQDLYRVLADDLIFSNIMSWEQDIGIAQAQDDDCVGNHRMLTCGANTEIAVIGPLWYYITTEEGFAKIYTASPGTVALNQIMTVPALMAIEVRMPPLVTQQTFERLQAEIAAPKVKHTAIHEANAALLPATLELVFTGEH